MGEIARGIFDEVSIDRAATGLIAAGIIETVSTGETWKLRRLNVELITTGTPGNRNIIFQIRDAANNIRYVILAGRTVTASLTETYLLGLWSEGATVEILVDHPFIVMYEGWDIFINDTANIDTSDTVEINITAENAT